jgi:phage terminase small subunit
MKKLTPKQLLFCNEYIVDLNATQAAIRAGYSENTAKEIGCENLTKPNIQAYISELKSNRAEKVEITAEKVLRDLELAKAIALGLKDTHIVVKENIGDGMSRTSSMPIKKTDLNNYVKINEMYMKHLGMFERDNQQQAQGNGNITVQIVEDRLEDR